VEKYLVSNQISTVQVEYISGRNYSNYLNFFPKKSFQTVQYELFLDNLQSLLHDVALLIEDAVVFTRVPQVAGDESLQL